MSDIREKKNCWSSVLEWALASNLEFIHNSEERAEFMGTAQVGGSVWWWKPVKMLLFASKIFWNRDQGYHMRMKTGKVVPDYRARCNTVVQGSGEWMDWKQSVTVKWLEVSVQETNETS